MKHYYKTVNSKPVEITEAEAKAMQQRNIELFNSGDFQKMLEIEIPLVIEK